MSGTTEPTLRLRAVQLLNALSEYEETRAADREGDAAAGFHNERAVDLVEATLREAEERGGRLSAEAMGENELLEMVTGFGRVLREALGPSTGFALLLARRDGSKAYGGTMPRGVAARLMLKQVQDWADQSLAVDAGPPARHILHEGRCLCGKFVGLLPIQWPEGHKWVHLRDIDEVTCEGCRGAAVALKV